VDQVIEKARRRLEILEREAAQLRAFIHMYHQLAGEQTPNSASQDATNASIAATAASTSATAMAIAGQNLGPFYGGGPAVKVEKATPAEIVEASKALMKEKQRPLTRSELVRLLTLRGLRIAGTDKSKNIGTIIWRSKQFENVEGKGYWPLELGPWQESEFNFSTLA
jgi:hypothetical protein